MSFFLLGAEEKLGSDDPLLKLGKIIDWSSFRPLLKDLYKRDSHCLGGRDYYDPIKLLKCLVLQNWHKLSDRELERSLKVRIDFMLFCNFDFQGDLPDHTTFCRFRQRLIDKELDQKIFSLINIMLEAQNIKVKESEGAVLDATIIESCCRPKKVLKVMPEDRNEDENIEGYEVDHSKDEDARWLKKGNKSYFGYKGHVVTDSKNGFIDQVDVTSANSSDVKNMEQFIGIKNYKRLYADKGYSSKDNRELLKDHGIKDGIMHKASKGKPLSKRQKIMNNLISKKRFIVEQGFGTLKRRFDLARAHYRSKRKVLFELHMKSICFNLLKSINMVSFA